MAAVVDALVDRGFQYKETTDSGWTVMTGALITLSGRYPCKLIFPNSLLTVPVIQLTEVPPHLLQVTPHLQGDGTLCYAERDSLTFDYFDAVGQTLAYIERAEEVWEGILRGEYDDALHDEFFVYWTSISVNVYDDRNSRQAPVLQSFFMESPIQAGHGADHDKSRLVLSDDTPKSKEKLTRAGWENFETLNRVHTVIRVSSAANQKPWPQQWPLKTFSDFLGWQRFLDTATAERIEKKLKKAYDKKYRMFHIIVDGPRSSHGILLILEVAPKMTYKEILANDITPICLIPISDTYMAERNTPRRKTLTGLRIVQVGCGTIGGFLAELLVKAGAGTLGGELVLVDGEKLNSGNVGRHRLGFESIDKSKARALAAELGRGAPGADLTPYDEPVEDVDIGKFDLLIDATGDETLGHWLAENFSSKAPQLATWIEGPGVAVRSLLRTSSSGGCRRCLCDYRRAGAYLSTVEPLPVKKEGHGCENLYVPFPATVSVQAACLAAEAVIDWANGVTTPNLRTRITNEGFTPATVNCLMPRRDECPACTK